MTPRKGNLMGVRTDIKVLDATIRDGGLCNNFDFSDEFVRELYKTNIKSGVDYMEFGYKASRTLFNEADFGKWKFCKEEDIRAIVGENVNGTGSFFKGLDLAGLGYGRDATVACVIAEYVGVQQQLFPAARLLHFTLELEGLAFP